MSDLLRRVLFLPPAESTVAAAIDGLHFFVILTTLAGAGAITAAGAYLLIRYKTRRIPTAVIQAMTGVPAGAEPSAGAGPSLALEIVVIGGLAALFVLWWAIGFGQFVRLRVPPRDAIDVYVVAKKWMWTFAYPEGGASISALVVPARRPVRLLLTSRDVIHSFYVPDFRIKQDAVPGRYATAWFEAVRPGVFEILCAEFCGPGHSTMRGQVVALSPEDYGRWLEGRGGAPRVAPPRDAEPAVVGEAAPAEPLELRAQGERTAAEQGCLRCHSLDGTPTIGPTWAGLYGHRVALAGGATALADEAYLTESMMDPQARVRAGFAPVMPSYQGRLGPAETAALLELLRALAAGPLPGAPVAPPASAPPPAGPPTNAAAPP